MDWFLILRAEPFERDALKASCGGAPSFGGSRSVVGLKPFNRPEIIVEPALTPDASVGTL